MDAARGILLMLVTGSKAAALDLIGGDGFGSAQNVQSEVQIYLI